MLKPKLSILIDGIFVFFISFFISYAFFKPLIKGIYLTTLTSVLFSGLITFSFIIILVKINHKKNLTNKDEKYYLAFLNYLYLSNKNQIKNLILKHYKTIYSQVEITKHGVLIKDKNAVVFFEFRPEKTTLSTVINAYKNTPKNHIAVFISTGFVDEVYSFFLGLEKRVIFYLSKDFYLSLKNSNNLPKLNLPANNKVKLSKLFVSSIKRENAKKFLIWGGILTILSTFTFYGVFYLILGTAFLIIATYLRFFTEKPQNKSIGIDTI